MMMIEPQNRFTRRQELARGSIRVAFFVFLGFVSVIGWLYVFFVSDAFMIREIEVRGVKSLDPLLVSRQIYDLLDQRPRPFWLPSRHSLFIDTLALQQELKDRLFAEQVDIEKRSSNILRLMIKERSKHLIVQTPYDSVWVDATGRVLQSLNPQEIKSVERRLSGQPDLVTIDTPIISLDLSQTALEQGIPEPEIRSWLNIALQLQKQGIGYREFIPSMEASSTRLTLRSLSGYEIWLDVSDDLEKQLSAYKTFEKQKLSSLKVREYVDVRIPNRIYVK